MMRSIVYSFFFHLYELILSFGVNFCLLPCSIDFLCYYITRMISDSILHFYLFSVSQVFASIVGYETNVPFQTFSIVVGSAPFKIEQNQAARTSREMDEKDDFHNKR